MKKSEGLDWRFVGFLVLLIPLTMLLMPMGVMLTGSGNLRPEPVPLFVYSLVVAAAILGGLAVATWLE